MSAAEVIELIKKLPPEEQEEVRDYISGRKPSNSPEDAHAVAEDRALAIGREYIRRHSRLFSKLAQ